MSARLIAVAIALTLAAALVGYPLDAQAANPDTAVIGGIGTCPDHQGKIDFGFVGSLWTGTLPDSVQAGFDAWKDIENYKGTGSVVSQEGFYYDIEWNNALSEPAVTICNDARPWVEPEIQFNENKRVKWETETNEFKSVAAHEFGHALGVQHVGPDDDYWSGAPTMAQACTIPLQANQRQTVSGDDSASLLSGIDSEDVGGYENWTPNSSFEHPARNGFPNGFEWWQKWNSPSWFVGSGSGQSGGVDGSTQYGVFKNDLSGDSYLAQHLYMRVGKSNARSVKARVNVRKWDPADAGTVRVSLMYRPNMYYYDVTSGACWEFNVLAPPGAWITTYTDCYPNSSQTWNWCTTSPVTIPSAPLGNGRWRLMIYVTNNMTNTLFGDPVGQYVEIDRTRIMVDTL